MTQRATTRPAVARTDASVVARALAPAVPRTGAPAVARTLAPAAPRTDTSAAARTLAPAVPRTDAPAVARRLAPAVPRTDAPAVPRRVAHVVTRTLARTIAALAAATALAVLVSCTGQPATRVTPERNPSFPRFSTDPRVPVDPNVRYGTAADGSPLLLDVCLPPDDENAATPTPKTGGAPRPALLLVHGGSWERGDKSTIPYRAVCQWLARGTGYPVFNADYQLAPEHPYPAAIDDLRSAVTWIRAAKQRTRWNIDPRRIGAVGGSAGANLVSLLATEGSGRLDRGTRVAAVVELSGPVDLTGRNLAPRLEPAQLAYLGCVELRPCDTASAASAPTWIDRTDPPFLIAHSTHEFIPLGQSVDFVKDLRRRNVPASLIEVAGTNHSITMLPGNKRLQTRILDFLQSELGTRAR